MPLSSGALDRHLFEISLGQLRRVGRTQESLDEGVEKLKQIYNTFQQVGIKDRSMIWNSYVAHSYKRADRNQLSLGTSLRRLNSVISSNALSKLSRLRLPARNLVVPTPARISRR